MSELAPDVPGRRRILAAADEAAEIALEGRAGSPLLKAVDSVEDDLPLPLPSAKACFDLPPLPPLPFWLRSCGRGGRGGGGRPLLRCSRTSSSPRHDGHEDVAGLPNPFGDRVPAMLPSPCPLAPAEQPSRPAPDSFEASLVMYFFIVLELSRLPDPMTPPVPFPLLLLPVRPP